MANQHPYHLHREYQVAHRRVHSLLKGEPEGAKKHSKSHAFSKVTSKTAASEHNAHVAGKKSPKRFARGGKVKGGHTTNIIIAHRPAASPPPNAGPLAGPAAAPPMAGPAPLPMGGPPGGPPGMPPGMPMRKSGGKVIDGESTKGDIKSWGKRAKFNSYAKGGAVKMKAGATSGVGRLEQEEAMERKRHK